MYLALRFNIKILGFHTISLSVSFDSHGWAENFDITRATYDLSDLLGRSCVCFRHILHNFVFYLMYLALSFQIVSFDSPCWTQKPNITRVTYHLFDFLGRSCVCLPHILRNFVISFVYVALGLCIPHILHNFVFPSMYLVLGFKI